MYSKVSFGDVYRGYTLGNHVLWLRSRVAVKLKFPTVFRRYTSPNETFEYSGKFNNASAFKRSLYWCQALHITNKDRYQSTSARRALALLN